MKTLKVKSILFSLLAMMAVAVFMTSCERESVIEDDIQGWKTSPFGNIDDESVELNNDETTVDLLGGEYHDLTSTSRRPPPLYCDSELYQDFSFECDCGALLEYADVNGDGNISPVDILIWNHLLVAHDPDRDLEIDGADDFPATFTVLNTEVGAGHVFNAALISGSIGPDRALSCEDIACIIRYILAMTSC